ncbi:hypothetical protein PN36_14995 [Candidatus Thiomargarita nelsonii]|uniref:Peptidase M14 domain-containing protein n=1 Tax=Candidatus Thiomargarita nelsonii TaxID=1003181 RepID=A0A0A6RY33_9GAMM|nr:hypothetical protein PN36_14995 [Candidatus Thiomargarita nelsonii]
MKYLRKIDYDSYILELIKISEDSNNVLVKNIGSSPKGRDIFKVSLDGGYDNILIVSGHHGDEIAAPMAILNFIHEWKLLSEKPFNITLFPLINPDGYENGTRENSNSIDLNRQYSNTTEVEIKLVLENLNINYIAAFDFHEALDECAGFFCCESPQATTDLFDSESIVSRISIKYPIARGGIVRNKNKEGSFRNFCDENEIYSLTFESPGQWEIRRRIELLLFSLYSIL